MFSIFYQKFSLTPRRVENTFKFKSGFRAGRYIGYALVLTNTKMSVISIGQRG